MQLSLFVCLVHCIPKEYGLAAVHAEKCLSLQDFPGMTSFALVGAVCVPGQARRLKGTSGAFNPYLQSCERGRQAHEYISRDNFFFN